MDTVWASADPVCVREVLDALNARRSEPLAYTTVMTVMNRLTAKRKFLRRGC
jgi:predicted transcriptional regulator